MLGVAFIVLVGFWTLFLVVLPYLYMVQESFHPTLPPMARGGPERCSHPRPVPLVRFRADGRRAQRHPYGRLRLHDRRFDPRDGVINFALCYPLAYYMAQAGSVQKVRLCLMALIVPYWVNEVLRAFALRVLLASSAA